MSRPKLPKAVRRIAIHLTLSPAAWRELQRQARKAGISASMLVEGWVVREAAKERMS